MTRLQQATRVVSSLHQASASLSSSLNKSHKGPQETSEVVANVFLLGSQCLFFAINAGSVTRAKSASGPFSYISFPTQSKSSNETATIENAYALLEELQQGAGIGAACGDAISQRQRGHCPRCPGRDRGICAVSMLHVEETYVVLFLVLECNCLVLASFALDIPFTDSDGISSSNGGCRLLSVRWFSSVPQDAETRCISRRQSHIPMSVILECNNTQGSSTLSSKSRFMVSNLSPPLSRRSGCLAKSAATRLLHEPPPIFVLRIAFVRVVGWLEYIDLRWQGGEDYVPSPWRALNGFQQMTSGSLRLEMNDSEGGMTGEVRALHWLPFSRDYQKKYPLLAILHQHALVPGDPFLDRLSICMVSAREKKQKEQERQEDTLVFTGNHGGYWTSARETICGSCVDGPWCVEALTLAHPSFLLHLNAAVLCEGSEKGDGGIDVLGVFLRPSHVMFPMSALLRETSVYATWKPSTPVFVNSSKKQDFCFALFAENGEVARCHVGGFLESACCFPVRLPETQRLSCGAAAAGNFILAAVLAFRSSGDVLLMEVWAASSSCSQPSSSVPSFSSSINRRRGEPNNSTRDELFSLSVRSVSIWEPDILRPLRHLHQSIALQWDGKKGTAFVLVVHEDSGMGCLNCSLVGGELRLQGTGALQFIWSNPVKEVFLKGENLSGVFPVRMGLSSLLHLPRTLEMEYNLGAFEHAPLQVLCQCTILSHKEGNYYEKRIVLFRSGDICLVVQNSSSLEPISDAPVTCKWLSRVQWSSSTDAEVIAALTLLFSSRSANICMEPLCNNRCTVVDGMIATDTTNDLSHLRLLIICRSTAILMTVAGRVVCISELFFSSKAKCGDSALCGSISSVPKPAAGESCPFLACTMRYFFSYEWDHFFVVSARAVTAFQMKEGVHGCFFLLLHVTSPEEEMDESKTMASVVVDDVIHVTMEGYPLFDLLPDVNINNCSTVNQQTTLCAREIMYVADAAIHAVPCILESVLSGEDLETTVGRFGSSSSGEGGNSSRLLDLRRILEIENSATTFAQPCLLRCFLDSSSSYCCCGDNSCCSVLVVVISFVSGFTVAAAVYTGTPSRRFWIFQVLIKAPEMMHNAEDKAAAANVPAQPFVRLVTRMCGRNSDGDALCWMLEPDGHWQLLTFRESSRPRILSCDARRDALLRLSDMVPVTHHIYAAPTSNGSSKDMAIMCGEDSIFTLEPCC